MIEESEPRPSPDTAQEGVEPQNCVTQQSVPSDSTLFWC